MQYPFKPLLACLLFCFSCQQNQNSETHSEKEGIAKSDSIPQNSVIIDTSTSFTFKVDDVKLAKDLHIPNNFKAVTENKLEKRLLVSPKESEGAEILRVYSNGFVQTVHTAYAEHRPLSISPDDIWLLICQGMSIHFNENHEKLKGKIFKSGEKKDLYVRNDSLITLNPDDWTEALSNISQKAKEEVQSETLDLFTPQFSTTTPLYSVAYQVTLLESIQKSFNYMYGSGCGIPHITLTGTEEDWAKIVTDIDKFRGLGLDEWLDALKPVLQEFLLAREGKPNPIFWQRIYKDVSFYGHFYITGWVLKFFPYVKEYYTTQEEIGEMHSESFVERYRFISNPFLEGDDYCLSTLSTRNLPSGIAKIDLIWDNKFENKKYELEIHAGFLGIHQDASTKTLSPYVSWAIVDKNKKAPHHKLKSKQIDLLEHSSFLLWTPVLEDKKAQQSTPIYKSHINSSYKQGLELFKQELALAFSQRLSTEEMEMLSDKEIEFSTTWQRSIASINLQNTNLSDTIQSKVKEIILSLPSDWKPSETSIMRNVAITNYRVKLKLDLSSYIQATKAVRK